MYENNVYELFRELTNQDLEDSDKASKRSRNACYVLFLFFSFANAISSSVLGSTNAFYPMTLQLVACACLLFSMLMLYRPSRPTDKERIVDAIALKTELRCDDKKYKRALLGNMLVCLILFSILILLQVPFLYVEILVVTLFFVTKTFTDNIWPSKKDQIIKELDIVEQYISLEKDGVEPNAKQSKLNQKLKAGKVRKYARIVGAFNAVFANGLLTLAGFAGPINSVLEKFGIHGVFHQGITNLGFLQTALYAFLYIVGVYTSYALTKVKIEEVIYSVAKRIQARRDGQRFSWKNIGMPIYSLIIGAGLAGYVCYNLYNTMISNWGLGLNVSLAIIIPVAIMTVIASSSLLGGTVFNDTYKTLKSLKGYKSLTFAALLCLLVPFANKILPVGFSDASVVIIGIVVGFIIYSKFKEKDFKVCLKMLVGVTAFMVSFFAAGSFMVGMVPAAAGFQQTFLILMAILCFPAWLTLFVQTNPVFNLVVTSQVDDKVPNVKPVDWSSFLPGEREDHIQGIELLKGYGSQKR